MNIKEIRSQANMTQKEFAEYFKIPQRTIENWEGGKRTPPSYVVELIKYKVEKERLGMLNLGEYKLRDTKESEILYVEIIGGEIFVNSKATGYSDITGKIKVYHDGLYFGTVDAMYDWINESVIDHLIENEKIVVDGETISGEKLWKWNV